MEIKFKHYYINIRVIPRGKRLHKVFMKRSEKFYAGGMRLIYPAHNFTYET